MKAIIFNTKKEAENLNNELTLGCSKLFDENTNSYSYVKKHPNKDLFCVPIDEKGDYFNIVKELTKDYELKELSKDWFVEFEI